MRSRACTAVALLAALPLASCSATRGIPSHVENRFVVMGEPARFTVTELDPTGWLGFEDRATGHWMVARYVVDGELLSFEVEAPSGDIALTAGFDGTGTSRVGFGGTILVDAVFSKRTDGRLDAVLTVRP